MTDSADFEIGRGVADITGEPADVGMLGYGKKEQRTAGIHTRLHARAFLFAAGGKRMLLVINELPLIFDSVHRAVLDALTVRYDGDYTEQNVMITATHTHCGPGGYAHHLLYNSTTGGFRPRTFAAIVAGMLEAIERAHADLAPATLTLGHGELRNASVNRSRQAFDRNPTPDRSWFPDAIDPQTTVLGIHRGDRAVGAINWFPTHNTSMTNQNRLISSDNKGYASYHWERLVCGIDYLSNSGPDFVAAFAQTNAGDMSPNLNLRPGSGPTENEFENTRIIGTRQYAAAAALLAQDATPVTGELDARFTYLDLSAVQVSPEFTGDGRTHRTSRPAPGASAFAGAWADGPGFKGFREGRNRFFDSLSKHVYYRISPGLKDSQAPKGIVLMAGALNVLIPLVAERVLIQLLRIGQLYLIGIPGEVTITAGLRLRRTAAAIVGAEISNVLVAGYSNGYIHYVTTPEEYDAQQYAGGSTFFGRWELPALQQAVANLAIAMRDGTSAPVGKFPPDLSRRYQRPLPEPRPDAPVTGHRFGEILAAPRRSYRTGEQVFVELVGANPNNNLHRGGTYLEVQQKVDSDWLTIADDGDWSTKFRWHGTGRAASTVAVTWDIPEGTAAGRYRIVYHGDSSNGRGNLLPFQAISPEFDVAKT